MAERSWEIYKICYCSHVKQEVNLEAEVLHPVDLLPDPPRLLAHRCSMARDCNLSDQPACIWAGTNSEYDPFK